MKISCKCQLRKIEYGCETVQSEKITSLTCDSNCAANKATRVEEELKEKAKLQEIEDAKNKKELELFEKKFGPKKVKERKSRMIDEKPANNSLKYIIAGISCFVIILAVILYFMIYE